MADPAAEPVEFRQAVRGRDRQFQHGDRTFALLLGVFRAAERILARHRDDHEPSCDCGHCDSLRFDPWEEAGGILWAVRTAASVIDSVVAGQLEHPAAATVADELRTLADLSDDIDAAFGGDPSGLDARDLADRIARQQHRQGTAAATADRNG